MAAVLVAVTADVVARLAARMGWTTVSAVFLAIAIGTVVRGVAGPRPAWDPGLAFSARRLLRTAIVLLGFRLGLSDLAGLGVRAILTAVVVVAVGLSTVWLLGRFVAVPRRLLALIGVGTAICGNSAIVAAAPIVDAREEEIAFASTAITAFGMLGMIGYPLLGELMGLGRVEFGFLAGGGIHDAAQAIASGFLVSEESGQVATVVKLMRTGLLLPVLVVLSLAAGRIRGASGTHRAALPWFTLGFAMMSVVRTAGDVWFGGPGWALAVGALGQVTTYLLMTAMAGVGLQTELARLRSIGPRPLAVAAVAAMAVGSAALGVAVMVG